MSKAGGDFRDTAARESIEMIGPDIVAPPLDLGVSLCHPCPAPPALWRPQLNVIGGLVLGFSGLGAGALVASMAGGSGESSNDTDAVVLAIAVSCSLLGFVSMFGGIFLNRGWVRRQLSARLKDNPDIGVDAKPKRVDVEDASTFNKLKICPDDLGYIFFDPQRQAVLIEGLRYRYTIFHEDLLDLTQVVGGNVLGVRVVYQVGGARLSMVIGQQDNLLHELRKQTIGVKSAPLIQELRGTFGVVEDLGD